MSLLDANGVPPPACNGAELLWNVDQESNLVETNHQEQRDWVRVGSGVRRWRPLMVFPLMCRGRLPTEELPLLEAGNLRLAEVNKSKPTIDKIIRNPE